MHMTITPASVPLGAEVRGVDLSMPLADTQFHWLREALNTYSVLSIRGQDLTPVQQVEFVARFGRLQPYDPSGRFRVREAPDLIIISNILENGVPIGSVDAGNSWHTDMPYAPCPPAYAALYGVEIPADDGGLPLGNTMMASSTYAYATLPEEIKTRLSGMKALHRRDKLKLSPTRLKYGTQFDSDELSFVHPVIRTHPVTGKKCLYVNQTYTVKILDVSSAESDEMLNYLWNHATKPEVCYVHRWQAGDLLMWDDCAIQHYALPDYKLPQRRRIHRATVDGTQPY
jgi:taurine dioxygenase